MQVDHPGCHHIIGVKGGYQRAAQGLTVLESDPGHPLLALPGRQAGDAVAPHGADLHP